MPDALYTGVDILDNFLFNFIGPVGRRNQFDDERGNGFDTISRFNDLVTGRECYVRNAFLFIRDPNV